MPNCESIKEAQFKEMSLAIEQLHKVSKQREMSLAIEQLHKVSKQRIQSKDDFFTCSRLSMLNGSGTDLRGDEIRLDRLNQFKKALSYPKRTLIIVADNMANVYKIASPLLSVAVITERMKMGQFDYLLFINDLSFIDAARHGIGLGAVLLCDFTGRLESRIPSIFEAGEFKPGEGYYTDAYYTGQLPPDVLQEYSARCFQGSISRFNKVVGYIATASHMSVPFDTGDWRTLARYARCAFEPYLTTDELICYDEFTTAVTRTRGRPWNYTPAADIDDYISPESWTDTPTYNKFKKLARKLSPLATIWADCAKKIPDSLAGNSMEELIEACGYACGVGYAVESWKSGVPLEHIVEDSTLINNY